MCLLCEYDESDFHASMSFPYSMRVLDLKCFMRVLSKCVHASMYKSCHASMVKFFMRVLLVSVMRVWLIYFM